MLAIPVQIPLLSSGLQCKLFPAPHHHPVRMITMRAQLAPALLLLLILLAAAPPLVPALTPEEIRDRKINGANKLYIMSADPDAYAGEKKSAPESKEEAPKDVVQKTSYVTGASAEPKPESKSDEKVLETKINAEVKQMRKEAAYDDAVAEKKAKEFKSKPKNTTDDAEDHAKEKKSKSKGDSSEDDDGEEKKSKSKLDYSEDADGEKKEKKSKNKDDDSEEKKSKSKSEDDDDDEKKEKKSKSKDDDDDEKKEKKSKSKEEDSTDDSEKKSKIKSDAYEFPGAEKKSKEKSESSEDAGEKKKSKSKNKEEDFDAVPVETKADESVPAADTPDGYAAPTKKTPAYQAPTTTTMSAADTPDGYLAPKKAGPKMSAGDTPDGYIAPTTMSAADTPDGYVTPSKAQPAMSAADTPDGYVTPSKAQPAMSATDSPDGYIPATDSPDGDVPASDSPDGYTVPWKKPKLNVQSFEDMVPRPLLDILSPVVKTLCAKTRFPYTCETSIAKLPETTIVPARQKDGLGVLTLAVDAVRAKIKEAKNAATDVLKDPRTDTIAKSSISDCIQMYDDINTSYDTALAALKRGDKPTATTAFDSARTFVDTCDNGYLDRPGLKPVIADQEKILAELSSNVLAINKYT